MGRLVQNAHTITRQLLIWTFFLFFFSWKKMLSTGIVKCLGWNALSNSRRLCFSSIPHFSASNVVESKDVMPSNTLSRGSKPLTSFFPGLVTPSTIPCGRGGIFGNQFIGQKNIPTARTFSTTSYENGRGDGSGTGSGAGSGAGSGFGKGRHAYGRRNEGVSLLITGVVIFALEPFMPHNLRSLMDAIGGLCVAIGLIFIVLSFI